MKSHKKAGLFFAAALLVVATAVNGFAATDGDVDDDGVVRLADALRVMRHVAGTESLTLSQRFACDVAGGSPNILTPDGVCDFVDAVMILRKAYRLT
jgi:hypothetical protein